MRVTLAGLLLTAALAVVPAVDAQNARLAGQLPTRGVFVPGVSLAGVQLGFTQTRVKAALGANYQLCTTAISNLCKEPLWLFEYTRGEPLGVGIKFHNNKVSAIFTFPRPSRPRRCDRGRPTRRRRTRRES